MNAMTLLSELRCTGIRLGHHGDELFADVLPGADLDSSRTVIAEHRTALLSVLDLQDQIVAAAMVEPATFDREAYDALWMRWHALEAQENSL